MPQIPETRTAASQRGKLVSLVPKHIGATHWGASLLFCPTRGPYATPSSPALGRAPQAPDRKEAKGAGTRDHATSR